MQLRSQVDNQAKIIGRLLEAQDLLVNEIAKVKEVLASLQQPSQSRSSSSSPVSASHYCLPTLQPAYCCLPILPAHLRDNCSWGFLKRSSQSRKSWTTTKKLIRVSRAGKLSVKLGSILWRGSHAPMHCSWHEGHMHSLKKNWHA